MKRALSAFMFVSLLVSMFAFSFSIRSVKASGTIYIRADGSIDPPTAPISSVDNVTYTITDNINDSIVVERANIVLDGEGFTIQGNVSGIGIKVAGTSNVTIKNCVIKNWQIGIFLDIGADNSIIENNAIQDIYGAQNEDAIGILLKSDSNTIFSNLISSLTGGTGGTGGGYWGSGGSGATSAGIFLFDSNNNTLTSNTISSLLGGTGGTGASEGGSGGSGGISAGIYLSGSSNNTLASNTISGLTGGTGGSGNLIWASGGSGGASAGICVSGSGNNTLTSNVMSNLLGGPSGAGGVSGSGGSEGASAAVWLDTKSYDNKITVLAPQGSYKVPDDSKLNTVEGTPILYFYNENSLNVSNFNVTTCTTPILIGGSTTTGGYGDWGGSGGFSVGLALMNITNSIVESNTISGFKGMTGGPGGYGSSDGSKEASVGVYLYGSSNNTLTSNMISNLLGGAGGTGEGGHGSGGSGRTSTGIYLSGSGNNTLTSNMISSLVGGTGGTGGAYSSGGSGGDSAGIYLSDSGNNPLTSNIITSLFGGTGGKGGAWGSGGSGGTSAGIYLSDSGNNTLTSNIMSDLLGGAGGAGGWCGSGGSGGTSAAVWLGSESYNNKITILTSQGSYKVPDGSNLNIIESIPVLYFYNEDALNVSNFNVTTDTTPILIGGSTTTAGAWNSAGSGGFSVGLALMNITNSIVESNTISGFKGMTGGTGKEGASLSGGSGGASAGIYVSSSINNTLTSNAILSLMGGTGGTGGGINGVGGSGGTFTGIYLSGSVNNTSTSNIISSLTGGMGGTGGSYCPGGSGGASAGFYLSDSGNNTLTSNIISSLTGGTGGYGGWLGSDGSRGTSYFSYLSQSNSVAMKENTLEAVDCGLFLYSSNYSVVYHNNFINNTQQACIDIGYANAWDNGYPSGGNYWNDYTGFDLYSGPNQNETGSDGMGDTPYVIDASNRDNYPLMKPYPWASHDIGITSVTTSKTVVIQGSEVSIGIMVFNYGSYTENFNVTIYANETKIGEINNTSLGSKDFITITFDWSTFGFAKGNYTVSAHAWPVSGETDFDDNTFVNGWIRVTSHGWELEFAPPTNHPIVDFAVYNGSLYAAADNKLYVKDGSSWNVVDAPTFVTSLEPYGDKLVVGGQGGLHCYNGTSFGLIFSVPTYIKVFGVYNDTLYAGTMLANPPTLHYCDGSADNPADWHIDTGFSTILNFSGPFGSIDSFAVYANMMYVGSGGKLYSYNGTNWTVAASFDDVSAFLDMQVYNGKLYLATRDPGWRKPLYQGGTGFSGRVIEFDGENWTTVLDHDYWIYSLEEYDGKLYAGTANKILTYNGTSWETSFNTTKGAYYAISMITYDGKVYAGMGNGYIFADPAPAKANPETIVVPEFSSNMILAVFMVLTMLAAALTRKNRNKRFD